jgi:hypothetical protein
MPDAGKLARNSMVDVRLRCGKERMRNAQNEEAERWDTRHSIRSETYASPVDVCQAPRDNYGMMAERNQDPRALRFGFCVDELSKALTGRANGLHRDPRGIQSGRLRLSHGTPAAAGSADGNPWFVKLSITEAAESPLHCAFGCFPPASPAIVPKAGKQKTTPKDPSDSLICLRKIGAGEGIRTLDPDLGKVVLYP